MDSTRHLSTFNYAEPGDAFVTIVYRSDYTGEWRTCLKIDGRYVESTDKGHKNEREARDVAAMYTGIDNGRGDQVYGPATLDWVAEGEA